jgi:hypothetical protein
MNILRYGIETHPIDETIVVEIISDIVYSNLAFNSNLSQNCRNCCPMGTLSKTLKRQKLTRPSCTMITVFNVGKSPILKAHKHLAYERAGPRLGGQTKGRTPIVGQQRLPLRNPLSDLLG